ncbi:Receptor-like protein kinase [Melia azedarach]|uniref:Receptor-like protein kinase n=1 Tax=Melia azedarach TaxID=155640 RepID=A0ACC1XK53_MELAZ|nr:Receptor-like protein kinase [Melia azedarach]
MIEVQLLQQFQLRLKTDGDLVLNPIALLTEFAYQPYFRSNTSGAADEMNSGYQLEFNQTGYLNVVLRNRNLIALTKKIAIPSGEYYYRATLDSDGIFMQYAHPKTKKNGSWVHNWFPVWFVPQDVCSDINGDAGSGPCGFNSYCRLDENRRPICDCLPGFSLYDPNKKFHGCKQDTMQNCEPISSKPEDFYRMEELPNAYWPTSANYEQLQPLNEDDCSKSCLYDCNCVVAVIKEGSCWKKKLPLTNGRQDYNTYGKALIKVAKSNVSLDENSAGSSKIEKKDQTTLILAGALLLGSSVFLNLLFVAAISLGRARKRCFWNCIQRVHIIIKYKKLDRMVEEGEKEFQAEVSAIGQTHHRNLVRLLGFCDEGRNKLLVYEFTSNGTLASYLFGISRPDWNKRIQLAFGIARGLTYLHEECSKQIIHCDIKPQNILLDETFTAKISDFGLAKLLMNDQTRTLTAIRGTRGYVAPEWFRNMPITAKVDVYSYGVMLLEIICCRKSLEMEREKEEEVILTDWVYDCYKENKLDVLVENDEEAKNDMKRLQRVVMVAIWCIQEDPSLRPSMRIVTQMIEGIVQVSVPPCPTPFASIC